METFKYTCIYCSKTATYELEMRGKECRCPGCQNKIRPEPDVGWGVDYVPRNRTVYVFLALIFGGSGAHSFYAGRVGEGILLIIFTAINFAVIPDSDFKLIALLAEFAWILVNAFRKKDANGVDMV